MQKGEFMAIYRWGKYNKDPLNKTESTFLEKSYGDSIYNEVRDRYPEYDYIKQEVGGSYGNYVYSYYGINYISKGYTKGSKVGTVTSKSRNDYPSNGYKGDYWYVFEETENEAPKISGSDSFLGNKSNNFRVEYIVTDDDKNDSVTLEIIQDDKSETIKNVGLGVKRYLDIDVSSFELGDHTIKLKATDSNGESTTRIYTWTKINNAPIISGEDKDLGIKNTEFSIIYQVKDLDGDKVNVVEKLNNKVIKNIANASQDADIYLNITRQQIETIEIKTSNTIEIEASDSKGGVTYRRYTFIKTNLPPIISGNDRDLGDITKDISYTYSVTDPENDEIKVSIMLDDVYIEKDKKVEDGKNYKVEIKGLDFLKIKPGKHTLKILATDSKSPYVVRLINFNRVVNRLIMESAKIIETDAAAKKIYLNPMWFVAAGADGKIEVTNNAFDDKPVWEDCTSVVKVGKNFNFQNKAKTATKWGIKVRMTVNKNNATAISWISTLGGAFE